MIKELVETMKGSECRLYATVHHCRELLFTAAPEIEIFRVTEYIPIAGREIPVRETIAEIVLQPDHATEKQALYDIQSGLQSFEMRLLLERRAQHDTFPAPIELFGVTEAEFVDGRWAFRIDDREAINRIRNR